MKNSVKGLVAVAAILLVSPSHAGGLSGKQIREQIIDQTVLLNTGYGVDLPLYYARNGKVTGDASGTMLGKMFMPKETGKWWVDNNRMCQQFPKWNNGNVVCFSLKKTGQRTYKWKRHDGKTGTARLG